MKNLKRNRKKVDIMVAPPTEVRIKKFEPSSSLAVPSALAVPAVTSKLISKKYKAKKAWFKRMGYYGDKNKDRGEISTRMKNIIAGGSQAKIIANFSNSINKHHLNRAQQFFNIDKNLHRWGTDLRRVHFFPGKLSKKRPMDEGEKHRMGNYAGKEVHYMAEHHPGELVRRLGNQNQILRELLKRTSRHRGQYV